MVEVPSSLIDGILNPPFGYLKSFFHRRKSEGIAFAVR